MSSAPDTVKHIERRPETVDKVIRMAWHDRTTFETINDKTGLTEAEVICLMRRNLKRRSFNLWRARVSSRVTKHRTLFKRHRKGPKGIAVQT
ncbi:TIGR03643 family protein [Pelagicoccus sp. SDUM812002]|uniref:TIGR03643 family protein n=1 Tax=Pelagicoccus sp. SDUM812002 TaxID=3041266 RepID=UPI00280F7436|nr:TIGR03643 family protein [Pelagicoccus sp. SDUM812002]MDQ8185783.1 TIGR03643 family protein [Pelagicoccus sp. SDUM812002]